MVDVNVVKEGSQTFNDSFQVAKNDPVLYICLLLLITLISLMIFGALRWVASIDKQTTAIERLPTLIVELNQSISSHRDDNSREHNVLDTKISLLETGQKELQKSFTELRIDVLSKKNVPSK